MSAVFGRRRRLVVALAWTLLSAAAIAATPTQADTVTVNVDEARVMKLPERVATIVIGNPLIADATLQSGGILVVTGKGFGSTNMLALDRSGRVVMDKTVQVARPPAAIWSSFSRASSANPTVARRTASAAFGLGDSVALFPPTILWQSGTRRTRRRPTGGERGPRRHCPPALTVSGRLTRSRRFSVIAASI